MKLIQLPNGAFVRPDTITAIVPLPTIQDLQRPCMVVHHGDGNAQIVHANDDDHAKELASSAPSAFGSMMTNSLPRLQLFNSMNTPLPCPHCGGPAKLYSESDGSYFACAAECHFSYSNRADALTAWNRRMKRPKTPAIDPALILPLFSSPTISRGELQKLIQSQFHMGEHRADAVIKSAVELKLLHKTGHSFKAPLSKNYHKL